MQNARFLHMGDTYFKDVFPFVDLTTGGSALGLAESIGKIIQSMPKDTKVIPGHGTLATMDDLQRYHAMLLESIKRVKTAIKQGKSLEQTIKQGLGKGLAAWGTGFIAEKDWITFVYQSIEQDQGKNLTHAHGSVGVHHH